MDDLRAPVYMDPVLYTADVQYVSYAIQQRTHVACGEAVDAAVVLECGYQVSILHISRRTEVLACANNP